MNSEQLVQAMLDNSNYNTVKTSMNEFTRQYIIKLLNDIILYVDPNVSLGKIEFSNSYLLEHELSQEIVGVPSVYSAIDGNIKVLTAFAEAYSNLGIAEFDSLCKEALVDFLNLHNGLFVVDLSEKNICELSLTVPIQNGSQHIQPKNNKFVGRITLIPVTFSYGTITFVLIKKVEEDTH